MWELIRLNKRKSAFLFTGMGICLLLLGYLIGAGFFPPEGGFLGLAAAGALWIVWSAVAYFAGDSIMLTLSKAREVTPHVHPRLFNVVEEMRIAAGLSAMPKVYIMDEAAPNAFATGRKPETSAIAVTAGLLGRLNRDELQGVVAHETSHILNRDVLFMTFAGVLLGSVVMISQVFLRGLFYSGGSMGRYRSSGSSRRGGGGQGQALILAAALLFAILAPILAQLLYFAISRRREYLADASAARLTRYPEGLASALEKISHSTEDLSIANKATAPMYIVNPLKQAGRALSNLTSTHPPITERIMILRAMQGGAAFMNYQAAFDRIRGKKVDLLPGSALKDATKVAIRPASPVEEAAPAAAAPAARSEKREVGDLMRILNQYAFLTCASCGLKIKTPPDLGKEQFPCPRCGHPVAVPGVLPAAAAAVLEGVSQAESRPAEAVATKKPLVYRRKGTGWETFSCACGKTIQLSPQFGGKHITCSDCGRRIDVEGGQGYSSS